jgi:DNA invertase Pin-like site-specific DNA recombinase
MRIGYARVSTPEQSCTLQREALEQSGCVQVLAEVVSGAKAARPALTAALASVRAGDTLVVWRLDRLGRSLGQLMALMPT